jgi:hypothetical protein
MGHGEGLNGKVRKLQSGFPYFVEKERIGFSFDPMTKDSSHLRVKILQALRTDDMQGQGTDKIDGVIQSEEERDQVGDVIGVKMGNTLKIDLAVVKAQPGHLAQAAPASVEEYQMVEEREDQTRRTAIYDWNTGS